MSTTSDAGGGTRVGLYRRLARNLGFLAGGTGAAALFNMGIVALMARALTPEEFGQVALLQTAALILRGFFSLGTQQPIIRLGSVALTEGNRRKLAQLVGLGLAVDAAAAVASSGVAFLAIFLAGERIGLADDTHGAAIVMAITLLFTGYFTSNGIFRLLDRFGLMSSIQAGSAAVTFVAAGALWLSGAGFTSFVLLIAASMVLPAQLQLWTSLYLASKRGLGIRFDRTEMTGGEVRHFLDYCWTTWGIACVESARMHADSLLVGIFVSVEAVGIYNVAKQTAGILRKVTDIYASAAFPEVSALAAEGNAAAAQRLRNRLVKVGGAFGAAALLIVAIIGEPFLRLAFGPAFGAGHGALVLLVGAGALQLVSHPLAIYVQVYRGPVQLFHIYMAALALYAVAAPFGIRLLSGTGAALGQVFFCATVIALAGLALRRIFQRPAAAPESGG